MVNELMQVNGNTGRVRRVKTLTPTHAHAWGNVATFLTLPKTMPLSP